MSGSVSKRRTRQNSSPDAAQNATGENLASILRVIYAKVEELEKALRLLQEKQATVSVGAPVTHETASGLSPVNPPLTGSIVSDSTAAASVVILSSDASTPPSSGASSPAPSYSHVTQFGSPTRNSSSKSTPATSTSTLLP
jgi:hypothetical protein